MIYFKTQLRLNFSLKLTSEVEFEQLQKITSMNFAD